MKNEYTDVRFDSLMLNARAKSNELGQQGWRLCYVSENVAFFSRPIGGSKVIIEEERAKFEEAFAELDLDLTKITNGEYAARLVETAWICWQIRAKLSVGGDK